MSAAELAALVRSQAETIAALQHQLDWFRRQIFGQKSERFAPEPDPTQMHLGEVLPVPAQPVEEHKSIAAHTRRVAHGWPRFFRQISASVKWICLPSG